MKATRLDHLLKSSIASGTRRGLVRLFGMVPIPTVLAALAGDGEPVAARKRHKHRKKKCAKAGQTPKKKKGRKHCCKGLARDVSGRCAATCASQGDPCPAAQLCVSGICESCAVCANGCPFSSDMGVQAAIDGSTASTLIICAGLYPGGVIINRDLTLIGAGDGEDPAVNTILHQDGPSSVITVDPGLTVTLQRLRITGGQAIGSGGGILNNGVGLTLNACTVSGNTSSEAGGGIFNAVNAILTLTDSTLSENTAGLFGGGIFNDEGGMTLTNCNVGGNIANEGGGIFNGGDLILHDSTVPLNYAYGVGGGIYNVGTVDCSDNNTFASNTAGNPAVPSNCVDDLGGSGCDCQP